MPHLIFFWRFKLIMTNPYYIDREFVLAQALASLSTLISDSNLKIVKEDTNQIRVGSKSGSLIITKTGPKAGSWHDFGASAPLPRPAVPNRAALRPTSPTQSGADEITRRGGRVQPKRQNDPSTGGIIRNNPIPTTCTAHDFARLSFMH